MADSLLRIAVAQLNLLVGDIPGNTDQLIAAAVTTRDDHGADLIVFPELSLTGYPPEDLLLRPSLAGRVEAAVQRLLAVSGITLVVGLPDTTPDGLFNATWVLRDGQVLARYAKQALPN